SVYPAIVTVPAVAVTCLVSASIAPAAAGDSVALPKANRTSLGRRNDVWAGTAAADPLSVAQTSGSTAGFSSSGGEFSTCRTGSSLSVLAPWAWIGTSTGVNPSTRTSIEVACVGGAG